MERYTVLLSRESKVPVTLVANDIAGILERPTGEITRQIRERPWILVEDVPASALDAIFEVLGRAKVMAKAIPAVHMPPLPPALQVWAAEPMPRGLFLESAREPAPPSLDWGRLLVLSAGLVTVEPHEVPRLYGTGYGGESSMGGIGPEIRTRGATPGSSPMVSRKRPEEHFLVDLVAKGESLLLLRIDGAEFLHDYLGDLMKPSSRENMKTFLNDVRARSPRALVTDRTESVLRGDPSASFRFGSLDAFETFTRWVIQGVVEQAEDA